jgi:methyltransferase (TIGR00027 family)
MLRAAHLLLDGDPRVFEDPLALALCGLPDAEVLRSAVHRLHQVFAQHCGEQLAQAIVRDLRATILLRNRYAEDQLRLAMQQGIRQYVMLGAGLDSFAHRSELAARLSTFELDLPATQDWKREVLRRLGREDPPGLHYLPADFGTISPLQALAASPFRADEPAVFSWLGVSSYLPEDAVYRTLQDLTRAAPGSVVVFSYGLCADVLDEQGRRIATALKARVAAQNEPAANNGFDPVHLAQRLTEMGYADLEDLDVRGAQGRYFSNRSDGLGAPCMNHMMRAVVHAGPGD